MNMLETVSELCPLCGEPIELVIDCSVVEQQYTEDCQVCCAPMLISVVVDEQGLPAVSLTAENG
ncbi:CPXCG motif-containing cysteine-rich protein [Alkalimarinus sediminis]|uniref:CPXCG motif-containing cysteine-rich protein n=1 Tax=Alkalimarinus sediminis TaxID=1632866 RepID=A0A9E8KMM3_9ALTE|nr:CPXCG motif-containing cysteine-rich protein [Alkalimarinus sediminis]UZW73568.1 CPXCG motif-containing cysteine-rich protein [Alkalimarinus sediminis]